MANEGIWESIKGVVLNKRWWYIMISRLWPPSIFILTFGHACISTVGPGKPWVLPWNFHMVFKTCIHLILWIRNPETLTRPLGFLIFTTAFKKFAWSPRALGQFLIPQAILRCSLSISSDFALLLKRCVSTRGFGCTDRELLAPQICRDMAVFVPDLWFLISWIS